MAACDYRLCDKCGSKTFYDANLNYERVSENPPGYKQVGVEQRLNSLDNLGDWAVLCRKCSTEFKTVIVQQVPAGITDVLGGQPYLKPGDVVKIMGTIAVIAKVASGAHCMPTYSIQFAVPNPGGLHNAWWQICEFDEIVSLGPFHDSAS